MVLVLPLLSWITAEVVYRPHEKGQHFSKNTMLYSMILGTKNITLSVFS